MGRARLKSQDGPKIKEAAKGLQSKPTVYTLGYEIQAAGFFSQFVCIGAWTSGRRLS